MSTLAQYNREQKALYVQQRERSADNQTRQIEAAVASLQSVLQRTLKKRSYALDFASLVKIESYPIFDARGLDKREPEPVPDSFMPPPLSLIAGLIPALRVRYDDSVREAQIRFEEAQKSWKARDKERAEKLEQLQAEHRVSCERIDARNTAARNAALELEQKCKSLDPIGLSDYFTQVVQIYRPFARSLSGIRAGYVADSNHLVLEVEVPAADVVPQVSQFRYVKKSDEIVPVRRTASSSRAVYADFLAQIAISVLYVGFSADVFGAVQTLTLNCFVNTIDPSTGKPIRPCLISVRCTRDVFDTLELSNVEPVACLKGLHAQVSRSAHELEPVKPLVEFNMVDPRFIEKSDVLSALDSRPNLAELSPSEFESLMTNLFEKMGLETKLTRPSRDGGVDCVAWDMRPVIGGKVVIQAKRYRRTVGVSAVRDLTGTLLNEGAAKGILVTTSGYGKSAFEFANNKPIELITGSNLLYLLKEHAHVDAKIEFPEDWIDPIEQDV